MMPSLRAQGFCLLCHNPIGDGENKCSPSRRCWVKAGKSDYAVDLEFRFAAGAEKAKHEASQALLPLVVEVLNHEARPSEEGRERVLEAARAVVRREAPELWAVATAKGHGVA